MTIPKSGPKVLRQDVSIGIGGGFRSAGVFVELAPFPLSAKFKGKHTVDILPPTIDIELHVFTPVPCKFELTISINSVEVKENGIVKTPGHFIQLFQYGLAKFGVTNFHTPTRLV